MTLLPDYYLREGKSRAPLNITLETTYRCNHRCEFCFCRNRPRGRREDEMPLDDLGRVAQSAARMGAGIYLTGGEPFIRDDAVEIIESIKAEGVRCGVNTNGSLLRARQEIGCSFVILSEAKNLACWWAETLRFAQGDKAKRQVIL